MCACLQLEETGDQDVSNDKFVPRVNTGQRGGRMMEPQKPAKLVRYRRGPSWFYHKRLYPANTRLGHIPASREARNLALLDQDSRRGVLRESRTVFGNAWSTYEYLSARKVVV